MNIKPLGDRVLVKRIESGEKTEGGIVIPDTAREKPVRGKVIAVGMGKMLDNGSRQKPDIIAGEEIMFGRYSGTEIRIDDIEHLIMKTDDILAVVE